MKTKELIVTVAAMFALTIAIPAESSAAPPYWAPAKGYRAKNTPHLFSTAKFLLRPSSRRVYLHERQKLEYKCCAAGYVQKYKPECSSTGATGDKQSSAIRLQQQSPRAKYWNRKAQHDYYKRMEKHQRTYSKSHVQSR